MNKKTERFSLYTEKANIHFIPSLVLYINSPWWYIEATCLAIYRYERTHLRLSNKRGYFLVEFTKKSSVDISRVYTVSSRRSDKLEYLKLLECARWRESAIFGLIVIYTGAGQLKFWIVWRSSMLIIYRRKHHHHHHDYHLWYHHFFIIFILAWLSRSLSPPSSSSFDH